MVVVVPLPTILLFISFLKVLSSSSKFDNEIIGIPRVSCERDNIRVKIQTARPFEGRLFVKGEFHSKQCGMSYQNGRPVISLPDDKAVIQEGKMEQMYFPKRPSSNSQEWKGFGKSSPFRSRPHYIGVGGSAEGTTGRPPILENQRSSCPSAEEICPPCECGHRQRREANWAELVVPLGVCNAKRDRVISPPSLVTSFVAIVSFHGSFITKIDRAYHIKCAFNESSFHVDTQLNVTMKNGSNLTGVSESPSCEYNLLDSEGSPLRNVKVGDLVRHEWSCHGPKNTRILVHDCFAEDGHGARQQVVDDYGCSLDPYAIPTPQYNEDGLVAHVDAYVFQFPDQASVSFQCAIRSCSGVDENCREMSPPNCGTNRRKRSKMPGDEAMTIHSPTLNVLELDRISTPSTSLSLNTNPLCFSLTTFGAAISLTTFLVTVSVGYIIFQFFFEKSL